jgi:predicted ATPase
MKIRELKISNLMSFPYIEDFDNFDWMNFEKIENNLDMNILIWANGSGKSNFIEIINQFCRNLILDYTFDEEILNNKKESDYKQAIQLVWKLAYKLTKHTKFQDKPSEIEITIELFDTDFDNIWFVCKNVKKINTIIEKYSELSYRFPHFNFNNIKNEIKEIRLKAEFDEKKQEFIIEKSSLTPMEFFCLTCIQERELLYICSYIHNKRESKNWSSPREPLKSTFTILSSQRDSIEWKYLNEFQDFDNYIFKRNEENNINLDWYYKCLWKIRNIMRKPHQYNKNLVWEKEIIIDESRETTLYQSDFWKNLVSLVENFLHKKLNINYIQWSINLQLQNPDWEPCYFDDLSAWQQSLLLIIFCLLWNDLENGFMVIDEPELHIHPQLQKELSLLFNHINKRYWTQFFLSTYSALFINEDNITNVYRFSKENWWTKVFTPYIKIAPDDAKLVHLLRFENLSKIFFVNKIIMVEWDSDLYFFSHYLKWLQEQPEWESITWTYEIVNINWKWSYKARHKFLNKFWIDNYFIWDRDNTVDYGFFTTKELWKYYQLANRHIKNDKRISWDYYNRLVFTIKKFYPQKYRRIIEWIEDLYKTWVFILKLWAIESYPRLERKWLQYMVNFCNSEFENRLVSPETREQRKELYDIFSNIFSKEKETELWEIENPF